MAVFKPKNRLVYFRISEDEFQQLIKLCEREGARSISDLAREAMHRLLVSANGENDEHVNPGVGVLDKLISEVSAQLRQLTILQRNGVRTDWNGETTEDFSIGQGEGSADPTSSAGR